MSDPATTIERAVGILRVALSSPRFAPERLQAIEEINDLLHEDPAVYAQFVAEERAREEVLVGRPPGPAFAAFVEANGDLRGLSKNHQTYLSKYRRGRSPEFATAEAICSEAGIAPSSIPDDWTPWMPAALEIAA